MIENPMISVQSDYLGSIINAAIEYDKLSDAQSKHYFRDKTTQQHGEVIIGSFLLDMLKAGYRIDVELNMTYTSIKLLPRVMQSYLQSLVDEGRSLNIAADAAARGLAAYLFAVGINEHDTKLTVALKRTAFSKPAPDEGPLWAECLRITTGLKREKDFLISALEGGSGVYRGGKGLMLMAIGPLIRVYKAAFSVDLSEYGLVDMAMEVNI